MSDNKDKINEIKQVVESRSFIPFTGGIIIFVYAFFWPESYGHWVGVIVRSFRDTAGF